ncbi:NACHT, LRR and PYD domains-containing protein 10-like [Pristis pectinata]|uniref:NACHT, LRR and PYD domains-containing protein 10-like n=1 Tax=Pristis pectinata TaxID=685728 RepID=UPI00223E520A|nr:NACHT, LRR and PYD domains-containing protein 10-like [Pristis pectinata]
MGSQCCKGNSRKSSVTENAGSTSSPKSKCPIPAQREGKQSAETRPVEKHPSPRISSKDAEKEPESDIGQQSRVDTSDVIVNIDGGDQPLTSQGEKAEFFERTTEVDEYTLRNQKMNLDIIRTGGSEDTEARLFDAYTDLMIHVTTPMWLFVEHNKIEGQDHKQNFEVDFQQLFRSSNSNTDRTTITVVCGSAGSGKSTMIQKIVRDWARNKKYEQFKFVFHFKIQNLTAMKDKTHLNNLVLHSYPYSKDELDHVWKEPRNILFILDNFDHLDGTINFSDNERNSDPPHQCFIPESSSEVSDIVRCLMQGDLLKGCSVLVTTRPWKLRTLRQTTIDLTFQIMGFTSESVKQYFHSYFRDKQYVGRVMNLIERNDILRSMCRNPLFCSVLASSLKSRQVHGEEQRARFSINLTRLFSAYVTVLLRDSGYDEETSRNGLLKLGELAHNGISRNIFSFETDVLSDQNSFPPNLTSGFMSQVPDKNTRGVVFKFAHSAVQDFVAALMKRMGTPGRALKGLLNETFTAADDRFSMFTRFLVGLSSPKSTDQLEGKLGKFPCEASSSISDWLKDNVKSRLQNLEHGHNQTIFLNMLHCFLEYEDRELMTAALASINRIKFNQCSLQYSDCVVLSTTLINMELIEELDLSSCGIKAEGLQLLQPMMHKCKVLRVSGNDLRDSAVKIFSSVLKGNDCKVQTLDLKSTRLTDACLSSLFSALSENCSLTELDLSNTVQHWENANRFTDLVLREITGCKTQRKEIRWVRIGRGHDISNYNRESKGIIVKTD